MDKAEKRKYSLSDIKQRLIASNAQHDILDLFEAAEASFKDLISRRPGIPFLWWPKTTKIIGGLRPKEYTILCGPTGSGKSEIVSNICAQLVEQDIKHFILSAENGFEDAVLRLMSAIFQDPLNEYDEISKTKAEDLNKKMFNFSKQKKQTAYFSKISNRVPLETVLNQLEYAHFELGCQVAFIDNINFLLQPTRAQDAIIELDRVTHELIIFCKNVPMHIVMIMHPRKTDGGRVESEFDIKGSSTAVQEAQNIILYNRLDQETTKELNNTTFQPSQPLDTKSFRELKIAKLRKRGKYVGSKILLRFSNSRFIEVG